MDYTTRKTHDDGALSVEEPSATAYYSGNAVIDNVNDWGGADDSADLNNFNLLKYFNDDEYCEMIEEGRTVVREGRYHQNAEFFRTLDKQLTQFEQRLLETAAKNPVKEKTYSIEEVGECMLRAINGNSPKN